jgi:hypothetical protein
MTIGKKMVLPLAIALGAAGLMVMASTAGATHPRPKGATPVHVPFVPAYAACASPNRQHGPPLVFPSCNPPAQTSNSLTVGTPDANGAAARSIGSITVRVVPHMCCPPQDVVVSASITDVRCKAGTTACGNANTAGGADYTGELEIDSTIRITDHWNSEDPGGGTDAATVVDIPFPVPLSCTSTSDASIGATCTITSSPVAVVPESSHPPRAVVEMSQFRVFDGGADGQNHTDPNTLFAVQGLFIP